MNDPTTLVISLSNIALAVALLLVPPILRWRRVARMYPDVPFAALRKFSWMSGLVDGRNCRSMFNLLVGNEGIRLSVHWPFHLIYPPFVVPWSAVERCCREELYFHSNAIRFDIAGFSEPVHLCGFCWKDGDTVVEDLVASWRK